jgi:hypothetical protein
MPIPLIALGAAAAAGGGGFILGSLLGGSDQTDQTTAPTLYAPQITYPYAQYSPNRVKVYQPQVSSQMEYLYAPTVQIESPQAQAPQIYTGGQAATQTPTASIETTQTPSISGSTQATEATQETQETGGILQWILIAGAALAGIWLITKRR